LLFIVDETGRRQELIGTAQFITDALGLVPGADVGQQSWMIDGHILQRVDAFNLIIINLFQHLKNTKIYLIYNRTIAQPQIA
jgi:hypothetical protein